MKYYFKVASVNRHGESEPSDILSERTLIATPQNLLAASFPNNNIALEWDEVFGSVFASATRGAGGSNSSDDEVKYKVYWSQSASGEFVLAKETNETRAKFLGLEDGKTYFFRVSAVDVFEREGARTSAVSASISKTLPSAPQNLSADLTVDNLDNGKIGAQLSWNAVSGATEYRVYYSTSAQNSYNLFAPTVHNSMFVGELSAGQTYRFAVSALNANGESARSSDVLLQTPAPSAPSTPTGLSARHVGADTLEVSWNHISSATTYRVYTSSSQNGNYSVWVGNLTQNRIRMIGVSAGRTVWFRVSAINTLGESPMSSPVSATRP